MRSTLNGTSTLLLLISGITLVNLIQGTYTELLMDEAYYWYFAQEPAWGYFDHPPMVAALVWLGSVVFPAELGVRFLAPIMYALGLYLLWQMEDHPLKEKRPWLFFWFTGSLALLSSFGFFMLPDSPLFFFSVVFLWFYKKFTRTESLISVLGLAVSMAAIMYSKYHGALFIILVLVSRFQNFRSLKLWGGLLLALALYIPHLIWLYHHDFISVSYHLIDRANSAYSPEFTLHFLINAIAIGGLAFPLVYYAVVRSPIQSATDRAMKFVFYGFLAFFLLSSFTRKTQIQWVNLIHIPFIAFGFRYALNYLKFRKWMYGLGVVSGALLVYVRFALVFPALSPAPFETHGNKEWTAQLEQYSNDLPVVFHNSYRDASTYAFYTGQKVCSVNDVGFRQNQFDIDSSAYELRNKKVILMMQREIDSAGFTYTRPFKHKTWYGIKIDSFAVNSGIRLTINTAPLAVPLPEELTVAISNPYPEALPLEKLQIQGVTYDDNRKIIDTFAVKAKNPELILPARSEATALFTIPGRAKNERTAYFQLGLVHYGFRPGFEGDMVNVTHLDGDP